jgi:hypothetical protein
MSERKRRPPSGNIKPGTPHPTKAYTVRGFDGRWISRKAYNAAKRAREKAKTPTKGGSLVKRVTSAVTKSSKGDLLKIKKGDKGIVRAIKDTYKFGQDTRRSANAVYKAGKVTRKVHDNLVKGTKEFVKGTVESGKATRRAYERLKPGGKLVKTKGSKLTKYRKPNSKIVRSPKGEIVRSPKGELTKSTTNKGGKLVRTSKTTKTRKFDYSKLPDKFNKTKQKSTQTKTKGTNTPDPWKGSYSTPNENLKINKDKLKTKKSTPMSRLNKIGNQIGNLKRNIEARTWLDSNKKGKDNLSKKQRAILNNTKLKGRKGGVIASITDAASRPIINSGMHFLYNKITGKKTKFKDYQSAMDALKDPNKPWFVKSKPKLKTWKNPYKGPKQPEISTGPYKGGAKADEIGTYKGGATVEPLSKKKNEKKKKTNLVKTPSPTWGVKKKETPKKKKLTPRQEWEQNTRNSPARRSGAFKDKELWERQKKHREWKKRMGRK